MLDVHSARTTTSVRVLLEVAEESGLDHEDCLKGTGLQKESLYQTDELITLGQEVGVVQNVVELSNKRAGIGVEVGKRLHVNALGIWGFAILTSDTVRAAIEVSIRFTRISYLLAEVEFTTDNTHGRLEWDLKNLPPITHYYVLERHAFVVMSLIRELLQQTGYNEFQIEHTLHDAKYAGDLSSILDIPVLTSQSRSALAFPLELLDVKLPKSDPVTFRYCLDQCKAVLDKQKQYKAPWSQKVRDSVLEDISHEQKIDMVAAKLSITERTLRRRLNDEQTSFREVYTDTRLRIARELLETAGLNVETVSWRVGYAEPASFVRAFSKRFGQTPGEVRR